MTFHVYSVLNCKVIYPMMAVLCSFVIYLTHTHTHRVQKEDGARKIEVFILKLKSHMLD
jgi:hypothetical protein